MKVSQSYLPNIQPPLTNQTTYKIPVITTSYSHITKFTTKTHSSKLISISTNPPFSFTKPCKSICLCTSDEDSYTDSSNVDDVVTSTDGGDQSNGVVINIVKSGKRCRRIDSSVVITAGFDIVWSILTDYEKLSDFIPALAVSRLLDKRDNYARLFQVGQQNLPLGFKFNAKAVLDCYEKELEILSYGQRRDIEFKMVEGDFDIFEGKWSIEEGDAEKCENSQGVDLIKGKELGTILSYAVEVKPKPWLPVGLIEDRLCKEIKTNLCCVRDEAHLRLASSCSQVLN